MVAGDFLEMVSAVLGLMGALLLAVRSRWAPWAWVIWFGSNVGWVAFGWSHGHMGLVAQNLGFAITSGTGAWVWLVRPWWDRRLALLVEES